MFSEACVILFTGVWVCVAGGGGGYVDGDVHGWSHAGPLVRLASYLNADLFFKFFFEDISPFCGATDTPVMDFLVVSALGVKSRMDPSLACAEWIPQNNLWCNTCWSHDGHHGNLSLFDPHTFTHIYKLWKDSNMGSSVLYSICSNQWGCENEFFDNNLTVHMWCKFKLVWTGSKCDHHLFNIVASSLSDVNFN